MTPLLWAAIGITIGAGVLHAALGMRRPFDRAYLSFASMLAFLAVYFYVTLALYRATTSDEVVVAVRSQVLVVLGCHASLLVFVPAYTRVRIPRPVLAAYWGGLAILFAANMWSPYGIWFSEPPVLLRGESFDTPLATSISLAQHAYGLYFASVVVLGLVCAVGIFRRGERLRCVTLATALMLVLAANAADFIRDAVAGSWPYVAALGFASWALIMPIQLARDFRGQAEALGNVVTQVETQAENLRRILDALRELEQYIHVPLETLETGLAVLTARTEKEEQNLQRLCRAVARLREVALSMATSRAGHTSLPGAGAPAAPGTLVAITRPV